MRSATFWVIHAPSKSRAMVEFGFIDQKAKLMGIFFTHGNVVDIRHVRQCQAYAKELFLEGSRLPPYIGG